ncbi:hypothetical protein [Pseudofrankia sp. BMG5.36]|uniref:hypothetical protein n=1 Tax=Pseudofrankia sp. BMG5.36 TaxID=1834512 RepID=UPI0009F22F7E|nr:hypothetical protein [Pseudofrankia sp. BMG5.36]
MGSGETPGARPGAWARETATALAAAPPALTVAAALVAAEGLLLVGLGAFQVIRGFGNGIDDLARAEFGGVLSLGCGLVVLVLARTLMVNRAATKSPVIVIQLLCVPVGAAMIQNGLYAYGIPLLVVAVAVLLALAVAGLRRSSDRDPKA